MAYIKRQKYTIIDNNEMKKELLARMQENGVPSAKARQLIYYPIPMSLIRWAKWLDPDDCETYLEPYNKEENDEENDYMGF